MSVQRYEKKLKPDTRLTHIIIYGGNETTDSRFDGLWSKIRFNLESVVKKSQNNSGNTELRCCLQIHVYQLSDVAYGNLSILVEVAEFQQTLLLLLFLVGISGSS